MELQLQKYELEHLERAWCHSAVGEQTADVVIPDSIGDVDRIIEAFGLLTVRDMECLPDSVSLSGMVQAGVLLVDNKGELLSLPVEIPFVVRKELGSLIEGGIPSYRCELRCVDARMVHSRKLLVRVGFQWSFEVYSPSTRSISYLEEPSDRLQLRCAEYPMELATATGVKQFTVNEELELPENIPAVAEMMKSNTRIQILDQKVVGSKAVFKTELLIHLLYEDPQGKLCTYDWRIPLSQFVELSADGDGGRVRTELHMTEWELEPDNRVESRRLFLRVGMEARSLLCETRSVKVIEDAYCTDAFLEPQWDRWQFRPLLDSHSISGTARWRGEEDMGTVVDLWAHHESGELQQKEEAVAFRIPVVCSVLYYDKEGKLRGKQLRPFLDGELPLHPSGECDLRDIACTEVYCNVTGGSAEVRVPLQLTVDRYGNQSVHSLSGAELQPLPATGEPQPAVILRRTEGEEDLWSIAKSYRTSPKLIAQANALDNGPIPDGTMLLIPLS